MTSYEQLADFVENRMRMSHVYQPVMLMTLLREGGKRSTEELAKAILAHDESQVEYYENVTKNMVGRVLRRHGIAEKKDDGYYLIGYEDLDDEQVERLIELCEAKLDEYKTKRGKRLWQHRKASAGYVSGTLRYEVLKRARFRCELCGISADVRALEVDHIVPRRRDGTDDPDNLQALCYRCNAMKRDRDDTYFRGVGESCEQRERGCPFCEVLKERMVGEFELAYAIRRRLSGGVLTHLGDPEAARTKLLRARSPRAQRLSPSSRTGAEDDRAGGPERGGIQRRRERRRSCRADYSPLPRASDPSS